jgi:hypothetical protein
MATSGAPVLLLGTPSGGGATANGTGTRAKCSVNFGFGEVPQACANFVVDVNTTGAPTAFTLTFTGGVNEQGAGTAFNVTTNQGTVYPFALTHVVPVTWWSVTMSALAGGTAPTVRVVGVSAS